MSTSNSKRRRWIINPSFQYRFIGIFIVVSVLMSFFIVSFSWHTYSSFLKDLSQKETKMGLYTDLVNEYIEPGATVFWVPKETQKQVVLKLSLFTAFISVFVLVLGIIISHRIAGPLHRLNNSLLAISRDEPVPQLKFRPRDEFQILADSFNKCVNRLKDRYDALKKDENLLIKDLEDVFRQIEDENTKNLIQERIDQFKYGQYDDFPAR